MARTTKVVADGRLLARSIASYVTKLLKPVADEVEIQQATSAAHEERLDGHDEQLVGVRKEVDALKAGPTPEQFFTELLNSAETELTKLGDKSLKQIKKDLKQ